MPTDFRVVTSCQEMQELSSDWRESGRQIGVVPTMGALHEGHLSLVRASLAQADVTVVTIFVNPTQFAPGEDLEKYPKPFEKDCELLRELGVSFVFAPSREEMYPVGFSTKVVPGDVSKKLEGEFRPTHFSGVVTVVLKLFHATQAQLAFFGQKDFQQVAVLRSMVRDLNVPIQIVTCPIIREEDGLAMSSRNVYLSTEEREIALSLSQTLKWCEAEIDAGETDGHMLMAEMRQRLIDAGVDSMDYAVIADPATLEVQSEISRPCAILIAAYVGSTRLIDNCLIKSVER